MGSSGGFIFRWEGEWNIQLGATKSTQEWGRSVWDGTSQNEACVSLSHRKKNKKAPPWGGAFFEFSSRGAALALSGACDAQSFQLIAQCLLRHAKECGGTGLIEGELRQCPLDDTLFDNVE